MAAYDKMKWHYDGDYPEDLSEENAGTHIGMFLTWCIENNLIGELHIEDSQEELQQVINRQITGRDFLIDMCDETFCSEDLNEEGNKFAEFYYAPDDSLFLDDYLSAFGKTEESFYEVDNSWENYDKLKQLIDKRFEMWKAS